MAVRIPRKLRDLTDWPAPVDGSVLSVVSGALSWVAAAAASAVDALGVSALAIVAPSYLGSSGSPSVVKGQSATGAAAVATVLDNSTALTTAGAKLVSVRNNGAEKASIEKDGGLTAYWIRATDSLSTNAGYLTASGTNTTLSLRGGVNNGAAAVGLALFNSTALTTEGAKIAAFRSDSTTERFAVLADGRLRLTSAAPAAPIDGDFWYDGSSFRVRLGGVTKTVTVS